jgi:hypothetical protein
MAAQRCRICSKAKLAIIQLNDGAIVSNSLALHGDAAALLAELPLYGLPSFASRDSINVSVSVRLLEGAWLHN